MKGKKHSTTRARLQRLARRDFIIVHELAAELGRERSRLYKQIKSAKKELGFEPHYRRLPESRGQAVLCLMYEEAVTLVDWLTDRGYVDERPFIKGKSPHVLETSEKTGG